MSGDSVVVVDDYQNSSPPLHIKTEDSPPSPSSRGDNRDSWKRSRSRSPVNRQKLYESEGTNTTSNQPDLQKARLFVGNVDHRINRSELRKAFSRYGNVLGVSIHKGFAFVQLDNERQAKNAIIGEDNRVLNGSRLHVEFSQAAKKAGAKYKEVEDQIADIRRRASPPPVSKGQSKGSYPDDLKDREAKLSRLLIMEKELAYYRSQERYSRPSDYYDRRSRRDYSPPPRDYNRGSFDRRDHLYGRSSPPLSPTPKLSTGGYRDSYPPKGRQPSSYESRDYGYGRSGGELSVGYGGSSGGRISSEKSPGGPPLGWPTSGFSKSNPNQRPFSSSSSWK